MTTDTLRKSRAARAGWIGGVAILMLMRPFAGICRAQEERHPINSALAIYDDAVVADPGEISIGQYSSYTTFESGSLIAGPGIDVTLGLFRRVEISGFTGMQHMKDGETYIHGVDDSYLGLKILLVAQGHRWPGIAVKPTLEVLGLLDESDPLFLSKRKNLVVPIVVSRNFEAWSLSYTGGYATRGLAFSSLKWEWNGWERLTPIAVVYASRATKDLNAIRELELNQSQVDLSLGLTAAVTPAWNLSFEVGRTVSRIDENGSRLALSIGIEHTRRLWGRNRARPE